MWRLLKETFTQWLSDKPFQLAAALAYYTLFSIAPLLLIAIAIAGFVFGREASEQQIMSTLQGLVGQEGAQAIQTMLQNAAKPASGIVATVVGVGTLLVGASGVVGQLQDSLNTIWGVEPKPSSGFFGLLRSRLISFAAVLGMGFLLLVSLLISTALSALIHVISGDPSGEAMLWQAVELLVSFGFITLLFGLIYKILPDVEITWHDAWIGAAITALLFTVGKYLMGLYLGSSGVTSSYGAAGSLVVVLLWVYYSGLILFFGAEFTQVYANQYGTGVKPDENAVVVRPERARPEKLNGARGEGYQSGKKRPYSKDREHSYH